MSDPLRPTLAVYPVPKSQAQAPRPQGCFAPMKRDVRRPVNPELNLVK
jgi:hypothetical protein